MPDAAKVVVCVATYNELENVPRLVEAIGANLPESQILVIDDNSPDGTGQWCDEKAARDARFHCLHRERKLGLGTAILAAMRYAIENDYQYMISMDADFSHPPEQLPELFAGLAGMDGCAVDVMIGSRYVPGGSAEGWPVRRRLMSRAINLYARWLLGLGPADVSGGFRCYRTAVLRRIDFNVVRSRGYSFQEEILWHLKRLGAKFAETPIAFKDRRRGTSKINARESLLALSVLFQLGMASWFDHPPA